MCYPLKTFDCFLGDSSAAAALKALHCALESKVLGVLYIVSSILHEQ